METNDQICKNILNNKQRGLRLAWYTCDNVSKLRIQFPEFYPRPYLHIPQPTTDFNADLAQCTEV